MSDIVVLDGYTLNPGDLSWEGLAELGDFKVYDRTSESEIFKRISNADIVFTNKTPISRETLEECPNIKFIGVLATGYDVVDVKAATEKNIIVCNIPSYGTDSVGQYAIALLLEICHHISHHDKAVHNGRWAESVDFCFWDYPLIELAGKNIGILGFGRIGKVTAKIASALGMNVLPYDVNETPGLNDSGWEFVGFSKLLEDSDVISLHCPLTDDTRKIINKETISKMKDGVILINNSRGGLIEEKDLADALNSGKVYAAAVDVVSTEPILPENPLLGAKNCIITPHISWAARESRQRLMDIAVNNLKAFQNGKPINVINKVE